MNNKLLLWIKVLSIYQILFAQMLDTSITMLSLVVISTDLQMGVFQSSAIITVYGVGIVIALPLGSLLTRYFTEDYLFALGCFVFIAASIGCGVADNSISFLLSRFFQGIGAGLSMVVCQSLMIRVMGDQRRSLAIALTTSAVTLAPVFGPFIGGLITEYFDWRWLFIMNVPLVTFGLFFMIDILQFRPMKRRKIRFGYLGALLAFSIAISALQFIFDFGDKLSWFSSATIKSVATLALISFGIFIWINQHSNTKLFNLNLFKDSSFFIATFILTIGNGVIISSLVLLPIWLQVDYGLSIIHAGAIISVASAFAAIMSPVIVKYVPEKYYLWLSLFSICITSISFYLMAQFNLNSSQQLIVLVRIIAGLGIATFTAPLLSISYKNLKVEQITQANSLSLTLRLYGANLFISITLYYWKHLQIKMREQIIANQDKFISVDYQHVNLDQLAALINSQSNVGALHYIFSLYGVLMLLCILPIIYLLIKVFKCTQYKLSLTNS